MEFDISKTVEKIVMQAQETQEEFIFETIRPYCENILQMKINKEELKRILLKGIQKPQGCEYAISKEAVRQLICKNNDRYGYSDRFHEFTEECLSLPPVTPKAIWVPVTERQPDETGTYIATVKYGDKYAVGQRYYHGQYVGWEDSCVIAWMSFPESYKESEDKE